MSSYVLEHSVASRDADNFHPCEAEPGALAVWKFPTFNARSEELEQKPSFRHTLKRQRQGHFMKSLCKLIAEGAGTPQ